MKVKEASQTLKHNSHCMQYTDNQKTWIKYIVNIKYKTSEKH